MGYFAFPVPIILGNLISECHNKFLKSGSGTVSYPPNFISWNLCIGISSVLFAQNNGVLNQLLVNAGIISKGLFLRIRIILGNIWWFFYLEKFRLVGNYFFLAAISRY